MANLKQSGAVVARCPGCEGGLSTFEWTLNGTPFGVITRPSTDHRGLVFDYRLYRCAGCGSGGMAQISRAAHERFPNANSLVHFYPAEMSRMFLPADVPVGIFAEFREAEDCLAIGCNRAAAGLFRSVLDKTLRENGYKLKKGTNLEQQIDQAAKDGAITSSRRDRAHEDIRSLGNDVLHEDWVPIDTEAVLIAQHYCHRILEDFYDDRPSVEKLLLSLNRLPAPVLE